MSEPCATCRALGNRVEVVNADLPPEARRLEALPGCSLLRCPCGAFYLRYEEIDCDYLPMGSEKPRAFKSTVALDRVSMRDAIRWLAVEDGAAPWRDARYDAEMARFRAEVEEDDRLGAALGEVGPEAKRILEADRKRRRTTTES